MLLSILIPSLHSRQHLCQQLVQQLQSQSAYSPEIVEVLVAEDNGEVVTGIKRQELLWRSQGRYVCFVDDDDLVDHDYIESILTAIILEPDVVTFDLYREDIKTVWSFGLYYRNPVVPVLGRSVMTANHLCAWRRELAVRVPWSPIGYGDDVAWYYPLVCSGIATIETHVPKVLYTYRYHPATTQNQTKERCQETLRYIAGGLEAWWHDNAEGKEIVVTAGGRYRFNGQHNRAIYKTDGTLAVVPHVTLERICDICDVLK